MNLDRFNRFAAEDAQRSAILTYSDARVLNQIDVAIAALNEALKDTTANGRRRGHSGLHLSA